MAQVDDKQKQIEKEVFFEEEIINEIELDNESFAFKFGDMGSFTLRPSPKFLEHLHQMPYQYQLNQHYDYEGPKLAPQMREQIEALINKHLENAYRSAAAHLGIDVSIKGDKLQFTRDGKLIDLKDRLAVEEELQNQFNKTAYQDNIIMIGNGNVDLLKAMIASPTPMFGTDAEDDNDAEPYATPLSMNPMKMRPEPK